MQLSFIKKHVIAGFIVHWLFIPLWSLILPLSTPAYAGLEETIAAIEDLTANGQKVAVIVMQMQTGFMISSDDTRAFYTDDESFYAIINDQAKLISHFKTNENVYFVDVNFHVMDQKTGETFSALLSTMKESGRYAIWYNADYAYWRDTTKQRHYNFIQVDTPPGGGAEAAAAPKNTFYKVEDYLESEGIQQALIMGSDTLRQSQKAAKELAKAGVEVRCDTELLQIYRHRTMAVAYKSAEAQGMKYIRKDNLKEWEGLVKKYPMKIRLIVKTPDKCLPLQNPG